MSFFAAVLPEKRPHKDEDVTTEDNINEENEEDVVARPNKRTRVLDEEADNDDDGERASNTQASARFVGDHVRHLTNILKIGETGSETVYLMFEDGVMRVITCSANGLTWCASAVFSSPICEVECQQKIFIGVYVKYLTQQIRRVEHMAAINGAKDSPTELCVEGGGSDLVIRCANEEAIVPIQDVDNDTIEQMTNIVNSVDAKLCEYEVPLAVPMQNFTKALAEMIDHTVSLSIDDEGRGRAGRLVISSTGENMKFKTGLEVGADDMDRVRDNPDVSSYHGTFKNGNLAPIRALKLVGDHDMILGMTTKDAMPLFCRAVLYDSSENETNRPSQIDIIVSHANGDGGD